MKRCKYCNDIMEPPVEGAVNYLEKLSACLACEAYWDGKNWMNALEAEKWASKMESSNNHKSF